MKKGLDLSRKNMVRPIATGVLLGLLSVGLLCAGGAVMIAAEWIGETSMDYIIVVTVLAASVITVLTSIRSVDTGRLPVALIAATGLYLLLLVLGSLLFRGMICGAGVTAVLIYGGAIASCLVKKGKKGYGNVPRPR